MMQEEHGLSPVQRSPIHAALATFAAFVACGAVPLLPFLLGIDNAFLFSTVATGMTFIVIGALKSKWSLAPAWQSAIETLVIGGAAAALAYLVGDWLKGIV